jgi:hypothetical protein
LLADLPSQQLEQVLKQCGYNLSAKTSAALGAEPGIQRLSSARLRVRANVRPQCAIAHRAMTSQSLLQAPARATT